MQRVSRSGSQWFLVNLGTRNRLSPSTHSGGRERWHPLPYVEGQMLKSLVTIRVVREQTPRDLQATLDRPARDEMGSIHYYDKPPLLSRGVLRTALERGAL